VRPKGQKEKLGDIVKNNRGFSLLELLIVVAIILIIATIALPSFLRSRQSANEAAAVAALRLANTAEVTYASSSGAGKYGALTDLFAAGLLDSRFSTTMQGYNFVVTLAGNQLDYTITATAMASNAGRYDFYTAPDYVIRYSSLTSRAPAGLAGEPVR
jgi:type IV pilus assembly protein PilA